MRTKMPQVNKVSHEEIAQALGAEIVGPFDVCIQTRTPALQLEQEAPALLSALRSQPVGRRPALPARPEKAAHSGTVPDM